MKRKAKLFESDPEPESERRVRKRETSEHETDSTHWTLLWRTTPTNNKNAFNVVEQWQIMQNMPGSRIEVFANDMNMKIYINLLQMNAFLDFEW